VRFLLRLTDLKGLRSAHRGGAEFAAKQDSESCRSTG
jgi:hypothetical protein